MQITLVDSATMALAFPYSPAAVATVKALPNRQWDPVAKQWQIPVKDFEIVVGTFPDATVHPDVWAAAYPSRRVQLTECLAYWRRLNRSGVRLYRSTVPARRKGAGQPCLRCEHDFADLDDLKVLERNVNEQAEAILALMDAGYRFDVAAKPPVTVVTTPVTAVTTDMPPVTTVTTEQKPPREPTPLEQAFFNGIQNAKIIAERDEAMKARRLAKRYEVEQQAQLLRGVLR